MWELGGEMEGLPFSGVLRGLNINLDFQLKNEQSH